MEFSAFYLIKSWSLPLVLRSEFHSIFRANELMSIENLQTFFFFFLWKKVVLKYYRCLKLCQVSENTSDFSLLCSPEMFNGNMILIVLKSFRELKFLVAILERFGNYLSIKNFKCQSSFFPDFFLKHKIVNSAIFFSSFWWRCFLFETLAPAKMYLKLKFCPFVNAKMVL